MKNQTAINHTTVVPTNPEVDLLRKEITQLHEAFIEKDVPFIASGYARHNPCLPRPDDPSIAPYIHKITMTFKNMADKVSSTLHGRNQLMYGKIIVSELSEKIQTKKDQKTILENERDYLLDDRKKQHLKMDHVPQDGTRRLIWVLSWLDVIGITAACLNIFQESYLLGLLLGVSIGLGLYILLKMVVVDIRDNPQTITRKVIKWGVVGLLFLLAIAMGTIRAQSTDGANVEQNAAILTLINIILFSATAYALYRHEPSKAHTQELRKHAMLEQEIQQKEMLIKTLTNEIEALSIEKNQAGIRHLQIRHDQKQLNSMIKDYYHIAVAVFIEHNVRHRTDGVFCACFNTILPLEINDEDETIYEPSKNT